MKRLYSFAVAMGTAVLASAQLTGLTIDTVAVHDGSTIPELAGYTTYRVYAELSSDLDYVSAVYGDAADPLLIGCEGGTFFQSAPSGQDYNFGDEILPQFWTMDPPLEPALEYDSWFTIGSESISSGSLVDAAGELLIEDGLGLFNQGLGFVLDDAFGGIWYNTWPCAGFSDVSACADGNPAFAGDGNRVLLAQLTANGDIYGMLNVQVFVGGDQQNLQLATELTFATDSSAVFGCTINNVGALNPDSTATIDDLSCVFPCALELSDNGTTAPVCFGQDNGSMDVVATGSQGADYFFLADSIPQEAFDAPLDYGGSNFGYFNGLQAGPYTVIAIDAAGCADTLDVVVPVKPAIEATAALTSGVSCAGASDAVLSLDTVFGGNGGYEYALSSAILDVGTTPVWDSLPGGISPKIVVFDSLGCQGESNTVSIIEPTEINVGFANLTAANSVSDATCADSADGSIQLIAAGGSAFESIKFSVDGENYFDSPLMVSAGSYTVTARDVFGCIGTLEETVEVGPAPIVVNATASPELCVGSSDGAVSWAPVGGDGNYTYAFNDSAQTGTSVADLAPGNYVVTVTDGNMCAGTDSVEVAAGTPVVVTANALDASCFGDNDGEVVVSAEGGAGNFTYSEDNVNYGQINSFGGLEAGDYTFFVLDGNNCPGQGEATVGQPDEIVVTGIASQDSPDGEGSIDISVLGGSPPYFYEWTGPDVFGLTTADLDSISSGEYTVDVTDSNDCSTEAAFTIVTVTSVQELAAGVMAKVYPNPSQGLFVVEIEGIQRGEIAYQVLDAQGRNVESGQWVSGAGAFTTSLDLTSAEAGLYRLVVMADGRRSAMQLVKMD